MSIYEIFMIPALGAPFVLIFTMILIAISIPIQRIVNIIRKK